MKNKGYFSLGLGTILFSLSSEKKKEKIRQRKLHEIVSYAKKNSPFYSKLYKNLGDNFSLSDLPVINKQIMMDNFDEFVTDSDVKLDGVKKFASDIKNIDKRYLDKYMVAETSGSTGFPAYILHDRIADNISSVLECLYVTKMQFPVAVICPEKFAQSTGNVRQNLHKMPSLDKYVKIIESNQNPNDIIRQLNAIKPKVISGYPGTFVLLFNQPNITEKISFKPKLVLVSGEYISEKSRKILEDGFGCRVETTYMSTETTPFTMECKCKHLHLQNEWTIVEAVDKNNNPVKDGELSDKVLITNLADFTQPRIRYEISDRVRYHAAGTCPCGCKASWVEVEGRISDILYFVKDGSSIGVPPMVFHGNTNKIPGISCVQGIVHKDNCMEFRITVLDGYDKQSVFDEMVTALKDVLYKNYGLDNISMTLAEIPPQIDKKTQKFRQFYME